MHKQRRSGWHGWLVHLCVCIFVLFVFSAHLAANQPSDERKSKSIVLHAIIEAGPERIWPVISTQEGVTKWLFQRAPRWELRPAGRFGVTIPHKHNVAGQVFKVEQEKSFTLAWTRPATTLTIELRPLDDHLTMVTLNHAGWPVQVPKAIEQMKELRQRWIVAMMKLHWQFPPPVVDTRRHRPGDAKGLFIERSLIVNGDFSYGAEPGQYEGVAFGWETNTAKSSPNAHKIDAKQGHIRKPCQAVANPPDWSNFAVQQFTSPILPMIEPGKRYRLTGWVKAEGIKNPAGWYKLGLWCTDAGGKPIGDFLKNEKLTDNEGEPILNHDWQKFTIEAVAPLNAARAVVILSGHWDDAGTVWYDDIQLWEVETPTTKGK